MVSLAAHAFMNKGQKQLNNILAIGDGPVTRLEECTWNDSRRISTLYLEGAQLGVRRSALSYTEC